MTAPLTPPRHTTRYTLWAGLCLALLAPILMPDTLQAQEAITRQKLVIYGGPLFREFLGCVNCDPYETDSVWNKYSPSGGKTAIPITAIFMSTVRRMEPIRPAIPSPQVRRVWCTLRTSSMAISIFRKSGPKVSVARMAIRPYATG